MINLGKKILLGTAIDALDYDAAVKIIFESVQDGRSCATTALAVHGVITSAFDPSHRLRLNNFELVVPDGQPVRWALNLLYGVHLEDRVYGPRLTLLVCREAARRGVPVFFYGSQPKVIKELCIRMKALCPGLKIAGARASRFRKLTVEERSNLIEEIKDSGAQILFVGLGCPRQEVFAYEMSAHLSIPILAVGAAFDYYSGLLKEPPEFIQRYGLQWLYRLLQEPRRLWRRYLFTNTQFILLFLLQWLRVWHIEEIKSGEPPQDVLYG